MVAFLVSGFLRFTCRVKHVNVNRKAVIGNASATPLILLAKRAAPMLFTQPAFRLIQLILDNDDIGKLKTFKLKNSEIGSPSLTVRFCLAAYR